MVRFELDWCDGLTTSHDTTVEGEAENEDNDDNGTITITRIGRAGSKICLSEV